MLLAFSMWFLLSTLSMWSRLSLASSIHEWSIVLFSMRVVISATSQFGDRFFDLDLPLDSSPSVHVPSRVVVDFLFGGLQGDWRWGGPSRVVTSMLVDRTIGAPVKVSKQGIMDSSFSFISISNLRPTKGTHWPLDVCTPTNLLYLCMQMKGGL